MPTYSILQIEKEYPDGTVNGTWIQDVTGTLERALNRLQDYDAPFVLRGSKTRHALIQGPAHPGAWDMIGKRLDTPKPDPSAN